MEEHINTAEPQIMHIDLNCCFAIIEQQANRLLRGRPVAVSAYDTPGGMVLASSYEAKRLGVKLGVNNREARNLAPDVVILTPDPPKYREAHKRFKELLLEYTDDVTAKSIDEFVLDFAGSPALRAGMSMEEIGHQIKADIREKLGEWVFHAAYPSEQVIAHTSPSARSWR
jgi:DNA polymerase-4